MTSGTASDLGIFTWGRRATKWLETYCTGSRYRRGISYEEIRIKRKKRRKEANILERNGSEGARDEGTIATHKLVIHHDQKTVDVKVVGALGKGSRVERRNGPIAEVDGRREGIAGPELEIVRSLG